MTNEILNTLTLSKRSPIKMGIDRGAEFYSSTFQNFLKVESFHYYSRFTDKGPSICERMIKTIRNLLKKAVCEKGNANWLSELPSVIKKYNISFHHSVKLTPVQANKKVSEKEVYKTLQDKRKEPNPKNQLGQLVRTADIKRVFSKGDNTNWS